MHAMGKERLWAVGSSSQEDELELGPAIVGTCPDMCSGESWLLTLPPMLASVFSWQQLSPLLVSDGVTKHHQVAKLQT